MVVKDLVLTPFRVATSKPAQKTYINLILFLSTSLTLLGLSTLAYVLFYYLYVPQIGIERPIHLQYGDGPHPHALIPLTSLVPSQPYTIHLTLTLPRSPPNLTLGPFMLALTLLSSSYKPIVVPTPTIHVHPLPTLSLYLTSIQEPDIIHTVRRPALIPYTSRLVSLSTRILGLPLYILGLRTETSTLEVELAENLVFNRKDGVPAYAMLEVQAGQTLQVYDATMYVRARFGGLRWWMWNHRILSAFVGIFTFWACSNIVMVFSWTILRVLFPSQESSTSLTRSENEVKNEPGTDEEPDLSDTPRTFPTYGRQAPLRYEPVVKKEEAEEDVLAETEIAPLGEADDEDDEDGAFGDSGLGTSYSEGGGGRRGGVRRRREKGG